MERRNPFSPMDHLPLPPSGDRPLEVRLVRGEAVESRHRVHAMVCDAAGASVLRWGDPGLAFFPRSSVKLMQAVAWVSEGCGRQIGLGPEELALACASHMGEDVHSRVVEGWLARLGLGEEALECGAHRPYHEASADALVREGRRPTQLHNNCSGKHAGLLTLCRCRGWDHVGYSSYDHPAQQAVRGALGRFLGLDMDRAPWGIDGCGIPTYSLPLEALARGMARAADPAGLEAGVGEAVRSLNGAIAAHPLLYGGAASFSSQVVAQTEARVFAKVGAEGVYGAWFPEKGLGLAMKCEDGNARAVEMAMAAVLRELGHPLGFHSPLVRRWTGEVVGQLVCG